MTAAARWARRTLVGLLVFGAALAMLVFLYPVSARPLGDLKVELTEERVARGTYLAEHVLECAGCHTKSDHSRFASPPTGPKGGGGDCFEEAYAPGDSVICVPNITPHADAGVGGWTDDELARAIRDGVDRDGELLYALMRTNAFQHLSDEDVYSLIAWIRSLDPVAEPAPETDLHPVARFLSAVVQHQPVVGPVPHPNPADRVATGRYLTRIGGCFDCHTMYSPMHGPVLEEEMAGGEVFATTMGPVRASNLTPHPTSNLPKSLAAFVARFRGAGGADVAVGPGGQTVMPWLDMAGMDVEDLYAIYAYLQTVPAFARPVIAYVGAVGAVADGGVYAPGPETPTCGDVRARVRDGRPWPQLFRSCRDLASAE